MANYNKKKGIFRTIAGVVCGVLAVAAVAGAGTALYMGATNNGWFGKEDEQTEEAFASESVIVEEASENVSSGISLQASKLSLNQAKTKYSLLSSQYSEGSSYELTVTYNADATNPTFTWSASSDAVTLTPSEDTKTCAVVCSAAFSEQVTVTVTANDNASAQAKCYVDYVNRLSTTSGLAITLNNGTVTIADGGTESYTLGTSYTAAPEYSTSAATYGTGSKTEDYTIEYSFYSNITGKTFTTGSTVQDFVANATGYAPISGDNLYQIYTLCNATTSDVVVTATFTGAITEKTYTYTYTLELDCSSVYIPVSSVELEETNLYF